MVQPQTQSIDGYHPNVVKWSYQNKYEIRIDERLRFELSLLYILRVRMKVKVKVRVKVKVMTRTRVRVELTLYKYPKDQNQGQGLPQGLPYPYPYTHIPYTIYLIPHTTSSSYFHHLLSNYSKQRPLTRHRPRGPIPLAR